MPPPGLSFTVPPAPHLALIFNGRLDDLGLADLLHQFGHTACFDELRADVFRECGEFLDLRRIGEEASQEMEALHEPGEQINERLTVFQSVSFAWKRSAAH